jgi:hypothetical protein
MPITKELGNDMWNLLHGGVLLAERGGYIKDFHFFEKALVTLLPCDKCREHYEKTMSEKQYTAITSNTQRVNYIHNSVNRKLNQREYTTIETAQKYEAYIQDKKDIKEALLRTALSLTNHWYSNFWIKKKEMNKTKHLVRLITIGLRIIGDPVPDMNKDKVYTVDELYNIFQSGSGTRDITQKMKKNFKIPKRIVTNPPAPKPKPRSIATQPAITNTNIKGMNRNMMDGPIGIRAGPTAPVEAPKKKGCGCGGRRR